MGRPTQHTHSLSILWGEGDSRPLCDTRTPHPPRGGGVAARDRVAAVIAAGTRPDFPFRTRKLRLPAPMVLHPPGCGRVGHRRQTTTRKRGGPPSGPPFLSAPRLFSAGHRTPGTTPPDTPPTADAPDDAADNHHTARRRHRQPADDTPAGDGVLSVNPAINTARQTTNTPTTVFPGFVRPVPREAPLATEGVSSRRFGCLVRWRNVCFVAVKLRDKTPPRPCLSKGG